MTITYLIGFILFIAGILFSNKLILQIAALFLLLAAIFYNGNVFKMILHKPEKK
jgi:energy-coupling factor transporter transmembrane protein EcfT